MVVEACNPRMSKAEGASLGYVVDPHHQKRMKERREEKEGG